jgi:hypothetical protein
VSCPPTLRRPSPVESLNPPVPVSTMSRPQIGIDRLPTRRVANEPREAMNCKSCRKRKVAASGCCCYAANSADVCVCQDQMQPHAADMRGLPGLCLPVHLWSASSGVTALHWTDVGCQMPSPRRGAPKPTCSRHSSNESTAWRSVSTPRARARTWPTPARRLAREAPPMARRAPHQQPTTDPASTLLQLLYLLRTS